MAIFAGLTFASASAETLTWSANTETDLSGYRVYYGELNAPAAMVNVGKVTSHQIPSLTPGKSYYFYLTALNTAGLESTPSTTVNYTVPVVATVPAAPSNLAGTATSSSQVALTWRDNSANESGFRISRKAGVNGTYSTLTTAANATSYSDTGLSAGTQYFYKILAYNTTGSSASSAEIAVTTLASTPTPTPTNSIPVATNTAVFVQDDTATKGNWNGSLGSEGAVSPSSDFIWPSNLQLNGYGNFVGTWANPTTDIRALQKRTTTARFATRWENANSMNFYVQFKDTAKHKVSLYFVDFDNAGRQQKVEFFDYNTGKFLAGTTISNFQGGVYSCWNVQGKVTVRLTRVAGPTATLSGIFIDPALLPTDPVHMVGADSTTLGTWKGKYGKQGHLIATETPSAPSYGSVGVTGHGTLTWQSSSTDPSALERAYTTGRRAAAYYGKGFSIPVSFSDSNFHQVSLYCVDFDGAGRRQRIDVLDAATGAVLDTTELSDFADGVWLRYEMKGNLIIKVTYLSGPNAVVSGVFFDASSLTL